jgi:hypothetical protein
MNLLRHGFLIAALAAVACGGGDDDKPKFIGGKTGGRTGSGGESGSGGNKASGGRTGDGGASETGGADGGPGGSGGAGTGGAGGSGGSGGIGETGGAGGDIVVEPTCTLSTGNEICDGCIHSDCSFQCAACQGNEDCTSILDCVLTTCTSGFTRKCVSDCIAQYPDGMNLFNDAVLNCGKQACSSFCPFVP